MARTSPYFGNRPQLDAMRALQAAVSDSGIDPLLGELVKIRASQLNGCAYCLDMHTYEAVQLGETPQRLHLLAAWREAPCYTPAERAALAFTEAVTLLSQAGVPDDVWDDAIAELGEAMTTKLLWLVVAINAWNRLGVATHAEPEYWKRAPTPAT